MFRKSLIAVFLSVVFAILAGTTAVAAEERTMSPEIEKALADVEKVNADIYSEVAKAQEKADKMYAKYLADFESEQDTAKQAELTSKYEEKITLLIKELDMKTQEMTRKGVEKATAAGITVEVYWIEYQFGDRKALIDPMHVVGW